MQAKVPQDIDIEDKIVGPFSLKQFIFLAIGAMAVFILYTVFKNVIILFVLTSAPVVFLVIGFTFLKINEQPFEKFLEAFYRYQTSPRKRIWQRDTKITDIGIVERPEPKKTTVPQAKEKPVSRLDELALILDSRGWTEEREAGEAVELPSTEISEEEKEKFIKKAEEIAPQKKEGAEKAGTEESPKKDDYEDLTSPRY